MYVNNYDNDSNPIRPLVPQLQTLNREALKEFLASKQLGNHPSVINDMSLLKFLAIVSNEFPIISSLSFRKVIKRELGRDSRVRSIDFLFTVIDFLSKSHAIDPIPGNTKIDLSPFPLTSFTEAAGLLL